MSQSRIQVGDLVVVVKAKSCGCFDTVGITFRVTGFVLDGVRCESCGAKIRRIDLLAEGYKDYAFPLSRLQRIDPLTEPTAIPTTEGIEV